ncbi:MAG: hypothetical protein HOK02_05500 [Halieaceae bacterium]|nr:hypothetical protein [Halieaceae bacterium]
MTPASTISGPTQDYLPPPTLCARRRHTHLRCMVGAALGLALTVCLPANLRAQGQDSATWSRDRQVIEALLPGFYSNANQAYFDGRRQVAQPQNRYNVAIEASEDAHVFIATRTDTEGAVISEQRWSLFDDEAKRAVRMEIDDTQTGVQCPIWWTRDAAQFSATAATDCTNDPDSPIALSLAQQQLWWSSRQSDSTIKLHRSRAFTCYADIPGVGGGRDEPYTRYDNLSLHDQGAETWFTDKDGRTLGLRLFNVDWPINNYEGYFTRDSLVIYVVEKFEDDTTKEHGYAFTLPEANRIGINLKWLLASCFMVSGKVDTPTM